MHEGEGSTDNLGIRAMPQGSRKDNSMDPLKLQYYSQLKCKSGKRK